MVAVRAWSTTPEVAHIGLREAFPTLVRRPTGVLQGTRWLFTWLALLSLLFSLPGVVALASGDRGALLLAAGATVTLWGSWVYGFLRQRVPLGLEVLDAFAIAAFAFASRSPVAVMPLLFASIWLRTLYGCPWRSAARGVLYTATLLAVGVLSPLVREYATGPSILQDAGVVSIALLTLLVAGKLRDELRAHDWAIERDQVLTQTGVKLLSLSDPEDIRVLGWNTARNLLSITPGLRVVKVVRDGQRLRVGPSIGHFSSELPAELPGAVIDCAGPAEQARMGDVGPLDEAVGGILAWSCTALAEEDNAAWLLVGAPVRLSESMTMSVRGLMNQVNLALRNSDTNRQLLAQAKHDALTGLENRPSFTRKLATELNQSTSNALHLLFLDLDDFKDVNDQFGHRVGDSVLTEVAKRLRHHIRPQDIFARLDGDEFAVVLTGTTDDVAAAIAHRMIASLASPFTVDGQTVAVGASVGVVSASPGIDLDDLVHQADVAVNAAKVSGKGQVKVFSPGLLHSESSLDSFEHQLSQAASRGELVVHYQPIVSLTDLHCTGAEALVRWQHPERGLLFPGDFVALAESSNTILTMGAFVLRQACADAATWPKARRGVPLTVEVNVSARELENEHFVDSVLMSLKDSGLSPTCLVLELTESVVLESGAAMDRLETLAAHGIRIALDDFGTGYSSLVALRSLPISVVKLDASFVAGALRNPVDYIVVESTVHMSTKLGIKTIAEGVETPDQQQLLAQMGADAAQGYLYCRGLPVEQFLEWLETQSAS
ncbi:hypothetical protein C3B61_15385 [Cryobacterium zongtaii]|uniref:GGDEF-domain containing protein n=1 Tax=Cryobacterium zongtaii TaxID=1259217 RepID=A0A2S3Z9L6_9MICO|nr:bifunctional diguanylate cyclase/phosphodiesterase [Cryobacterium zongtaii]POH62268.1 hypothetical protein C3B61_15385 [Cryobacterium zongtaii]